jgi:hypothetical protein
MAAGFRRGDGDVKIHAEKQDRLEVPLLRNKDAN